MKYQGSCHCGQVAFVVEGEIGEVLSCNCSMCQRKGSLLWFLPRTALNLKTPADDMATYTFNKHVIQHHFCPNCGIHPFGEGAAPNGDMMAAVNVRCLEGVEIDQLKVQHYDGRKI
jgi:hypothetical protein